VLDALADLVLLIHLAVVVFIVGGLVAIAWGRLRRWSWVDRPVFRLLHLCAIGVVVVQAWFGQACGLTVLESWLRMRAGGRGYTKGFIEHWVHAILFYEAPGWVFTVAYTLFGAAVLAAWWLFPPSGSKRQDRVPPASR
jgi:hypothetical protein